ncbi:MYG1 family protein [Loktanella sp. DJP18]|uniref:MYG1 family protein n=1 Tax=Loktanella sp. DJP18 TaxID=3409788 RepID=UPI003BB5C14B
MTPEFLVTHSGGFHADELMSSAVLSRLYPAARIVRSRDAAWITPGSDRIVYDVGGGYDAERNLFDHHQRDAPLRDDGQPFSSFGLVWQHFGKAYLAALSVPQADIETVHAKVDAGFVLPIDLLDNGALSPTVAGPLAGMTLPGLLETLKPVFDQGGPTAETEAFHNALTIARAFLEARVARSAAGLRADGMVMDAIAAAGQGRVLELPMGMPFRPAVIRAGADHLLFVITPRGEGDWTLGGIAKEAQGFDLRADLPAAWAGLTGEALERASGIPGAEFCHNGRFIAAATTRAAIVAMAERAVIEAEAAGH